MRASTRVGDMVARKQSLQFSYQHGLRGKGFGAMNNLHTWLLVHENAEALRLDACRRGKPREYPSHPHHERIIPRQEFLLEFRLARIARGDVRLKSPLQRCALL